jgi:hypothetical protein
LVRIIHCFFYNKKINTDVWRLVYTQAAPVAFADVGWKYHLVFILVPAMSTPLMWFKFPETKGLSLEEIGAFFGDEIADGSDPVRHR